MTGMSSNMRNNEELLLQDNRKNEDIDLQINMKLDEYRNLYDTHNIIMATIQFSTVLLGRFEEKLMKSFQRQILSGNVATNFSSPPLIALSG